jgi:hypothetical protein
MVAFAVKIQTTDWRLNLPYKKRFDYAATVYDVGRTQADSNNQVES